MSAVLDPLAFCFRSLAADPNVAPVFTLPFRPVLTVADEPLVRFRIFVMWDDTETNGVFDDFEVNRREAFSILKKHRRAGAYVEKRADCFYIEPKS